MTLGAIEITQGLPLTATQGLSPSEFNDKLKRGLSLKEEPISIVNKEKNNKGEHNNKDVIPEKGTPSSLAQGLSLKLKER